MAHLLRRSRVARVHRWLGAALAPVIALILLSGIVLAARPTYEARRAHARAVVDVPRVVALAERLDSTSAEKALEVDPEGTRITIAYPDRAPLGPFDIVTGARVAAQTDAAPTLFDRAGAIHNDLGIRQGWLVALGSVALVLIAAVGPFLSRNAGRGTILGTHVNTGWLLMPLALYLPTTLVMMRLELPQRSPKNGATIPVAAALRQASAQMDMRGVALVQTLPGWTFIIARDSLGRPERYRLQDGVLLPLKGRVARLGYRLHEGAWGGPVGGLFNAAAALVMLWMLATGLLSLWRRARVGRAPASAVRAAT